MIQNVLPFQTPLWVVEFAVFQRRAAICRVGEKLPTFNHFTHLSVSKWVAPKLQTWRLGGRLVATFNNVTPLVVVIKRTRAQRTLRKWRKVTTVKPEEETLNFQVQSNEIVSSPGYTSRPPQSTSQSENTPYQRFRSQVKMYCGVRNHLESTGFDTSNIPHGMRPFGWDNPYMFVTPENLNPLPGRNIPTCMTRGIESSLASKYMTIDPHTDVYINVIENMIICTYHLYRSRTYADKIMALATYAKLNHDALDATSVTLITLISAYGYFFPNAELETQSWESTNWEMPDLRSFLDSYERLKTTPFFEKMYKFSMYAMSLSLFKGLGLDMDYMKFSKIAQNAIKKEYHIGPDFIHCMLDTVVFLCERGYQCLRMGSLDPIFHCADKYQEWYDTAEVLLRHSKFLSNPDALKIDRYAWLSDIRNHIEIGQSLARNALKKPEKILVKNMLCKLELAKDEETTKRAAQRTRKAPFCVLVYGGTSVAKSTFKDMLFQFSGKILELCTDPEFMYVINPTDPFMSGFNSSQWFVVLDDIAFMNPQLGVMDPTLAHMLCIANNVAFVPVQAELSDKGRTPMLPRVLCGTTNSEDLNVHAYFACPLAVQRRFPWIIDLKPKPEFARGMMIDPSKLDIIEDGTFPNYWIIEVKRVVACGDNRKRQQGKTESYKTFNDLNLFLKWYAEELIKHERVQEKVINCGNSMKNAVLCKQCYVPLAMHSGTEQCLQTQADEIQIFEEDRQVASFIYNTPTEYIPISSEEIQMFETTQAKRMIYFYYCLYRIIMMCGLFQWIAIWWWGYFWYWNMVPTKEKTFIARAAFREMGARFQKRIGYPVHLKKIALAIGSGGAAYLIIKKIFDSYTALVPQGLSSSKGVEPIPDPTDVRPDVSYVNENYVTSGDFSQHTLSAKCRDPTYLKEQIANSTVVFKTKYEGVCRVVQALNVRGNVYMCNAHGLPPIENFSDQSFHIDVISAPTGKLTSNMKNILVTANMWCRCEEADVIFIYLRIRPPGVNLSHYFPLRSYKGKLDGTYIGRSITGESYRNEVKALVECTRSWKVHDRVVTGQIWLGKASTATEVGECGMPLFSQTPAGPMILGIHTLGNGTTCGAQRINEDTIWNACNFLEPKFVARGFPKVSEPSCERVVTDLSPQSVAFKANTGIANVYGSFAGEFRQRGRTNVAPTLIRDACVKRGCVERKTAPDMGRTPWLHAMNDMNRPVTLLNTELIGQCVEGFIQQYSGLDMRKVQVYSNRVAVNGMAGVRYCDSINRKSSAGCPYKRSKKHYMSYINEAINDDMQVNSEIEAAMDEIIETYQRGERCHPVFCGHLKDEPVSFEKARNGKTRLFTASPFAWTLVVRKYLLSVIMLMQNNRDLFECGPGIIVQSQEWSQLYKHLTKYGSERMIAGDYAKFDKRMPATIILAAFDIILDICQKAGYTEDDLNVVRGIAADIAYPTVDFNGDLFEFFGSNPSGHPLTVIVNNLANSIYVRYCFGQLQYEKFQKLLIPLSDFQQYVAAMMYGDDNIMGVHESIPWFNHTAIQKVLALVDITYTMADKEALSVPYIPVESCNFLKRTWRFDEGVGDWVAPLDPESIDKMLTIHVKSKNVTDQHQSIEVIGTAMREYFFYGQEIFDLKESMFRDIVDECDLNLYVDDTTFPTWDSLKKSFYDKSIHLDLS